MSDDSRIEKERAAHVERYEPVRSGERERRRRQAGVAQRQGTSKRGKAGEEGQGARSGACRDAEARAPRVPQEDGDE